jgi:vesicle coat complex subunit
VPHVHKRRHLQVYILECLAAQTSESADKAESLITRVISRLQHANSAVVLAAVKVVLSHLGKVSTAELRAEFLRKLAAPLVSLLSQRPEVQYVALRNINLILQKYPEVLASEARVFYCKYNDPIYVKLEKLEIIVALASDNNIAGAARVQLSCGAHMQTALHLKPRLLVQECTRNLRQDKTEARAPFKSCLPLAVG